MNYTQEEIELLVLGIKESNNEIEQYKRTINAFIERDNHHVKELEKLMRSNTSLGKTHVRLKSEIEQLQAELYNTQEDLLVTVESLGDLAVENKQLKHDLQTANRKIEGEL